MIRYEDLTVYADLGAEKVFADENKAEIAIEIKVLGGISTISEFEKALGQYILYRTFIEQIPLNRELYLAVSDKIFEKFFERPSIKVVVTIQKIKLLIFNPEVEEIIKWIK